MRKGNYTNTAAPDDILQSATAGQLEQAAAFNHKELFCLNALSVNGEVHHTSGVTWTHGGDSMESMITFPKLQDDHASGALDQIMQYYLRHPPRGAGCWSLDPAQPRDLGVRLLARGFQPGWRPRWMALDLEALQVNHPIPDGLQVVQDNSISLENIPDLPYGDTDVRIFSNQPGDHAARLYRFIARLNGKVVAHCSVFLTKGTLGAAGIYHVGVLPGMRNRGIGKAVVGAACSYAKTRGYRYTLLNGTGQRMYEQLGFKVLGYGLTWWLKTSRLVAHPPTLQEVELAEAIGRGDIDALKILERNSRLPDLKARITNGMSLMQLAVHFQQTTSAEWLISRGLPLSILGAWDLGWKDRAAAIIKEYPQQVNQQYGDSKLTVLHIAAERNDTELAKLALAAKPDLEIKDETYNSTALDWARHLHADDITRLLEAYLGG